MIRNINIAIVNDLSYFYARKPMQNQIKTGNAGFHLKKEPLHKNLKMILLEKSLDIENNNFD